MDCLISNQEAPKEYSNIDSINGYYCGEHNNENYIELYDYEHNFDSDKCEKNNKVVNFLEKLENSINKIFSIYFTLLNEYKGFLIINLIGFVLYITIIYDLATRF